ncbi:MAG: RlmE family RNA methyltransferase [Candidatus Heimdallarchaeota archaeon]|nr:RlmE family RNA methyltransferase [Candidatus Heimdallarchaeota archaeon]
MRKRRDVYTKRAKKEGYRSRAAYKLIQINKKFKIFNEKQIVIDLCGAPGGFSQIARDTTNGSAKIYLVDIARIKPIPGITNIIKGDITDYKTILQLRVNIEKVLRDSNQIIVLADCSPNISGNWATDHSRQIWLSEVALGIANYFLADTFLTKVFQGEFLKDFVKMIETYYGNVKTYKPPTSRKSSSEIYIIAQRRKDTQMDRFSKESLYKDEE